MKFVIHFPTCGNPATLSASQFTDQDFGVVTPAPFEAHLGRISVISSVAPHTRSTPNDPALVFWDGAFISDDGAHNHLLDNSSPTAAAVAISSYLDGVSAGETPIHLSGVFGAARIDEDGSFMLSPDPLSQYAFFRLERSGHTLISNSLHLIEKAAARLGFACERDFTSNAFEAAFGVGGWTKTGLAGVEKLPTGYAVVGDGKQARLKRFSMPWKNQYGTYEASMRAAASGLMKRANSLAQTLPDRGLAIDLSGGKDTRLVLGSFLGAKARNFHVFTGGPEGGPDRGVANRLINHFDLKRSGFLSNVGPGEIIDPIAATARAAFRSMGSSNLFHTGLGVERLSNVAQVRGGCAEARTKSFFPSTKPHQQKKMQSYHRSLAASEGWSLRLKQLLRAASTTFTAQFAAQLISRSRFTHQLFTDEFLHQAARAFEHQIDWLLAQDISEANVKDAYYLADRGWRHSGFTVQVINDSRPTFEPLNDVRLVSAQAALSVDDRDRARLTYDIMTQFGVPGLIEVPFAASDWPVELMSDPQKLVRAELSKMTAQPVNAEALTRPQGDIRGIHNLGRQAYMEAVQYHFLELAGDLERSSSVWSILDRDELLAAIQSGEFATTKFALVGSRLYYGLVWITGQEERTVLD
ncbi:MAG: hypothetical protein JJ850_11705 [Kordiimonadaceae bacterium]|nr:hypothetical protein [Kordiimonadaceae bacterium]MBO6568747.1 hypothetical protein [Kordiimonadaceae bacterium]MBO6965277.1 hypothetical protein [Kordiimonadaceae bacterium]